MIKQTDLETLLDVYNQEYTFYVNDVPVNGRRCSVYVVPVRETPERDFEDMTIDERIDYFVERFSYDVICDNEDYLIECLSELWGEEFVQECKSDIKWQIECKNIDPNGKMGLKLVMH